MDKGSKSSLEEDTTIASVPKGPGDTGKAEAMPLAGAMAAVESQDMHMSRGLPAQAPSSALSGLPELRFGALHS